MAVISCKNLKPARRYSKALIELVQANEGFNAEYGLKLKEELEFAAKTLNENAEFKNFIQNPVISKADKKDVLNKIFGGRVSEHILHFLFLLTENNRINMLQDIVLSFSEDTDKLQNIVRAKVASAVELNDVQKNALLEKLQAKARVKIVPEYETDEAVLGGIIIKINDTVIDLSIKKKIENLKYLKTGER